ncbi:MAG: hypothetical protein QM537_03550 [Candidatus Symbiobacter sp.]|nr:hypothetical protein [Candidatus Symbiobacter sp.]
MNTKKPNLDARGRIAFKIEWQDNETPETCLVKFSCFIEDDAIWPIPVKSDQKNFDLSEVGVEIFASDLLTHLADFWSDIMISQTNPLSRYATRVNQADILRPSQYRSSLSKLKKYLSEKDFDRIDRAYFDFENSHNLSRAFGGIYLDQPLWILRQGDVFLVDNGVEYGNVPFLVDYNQMRQELVKLGDQIAEKLEPYHNYSDNDYGWIVEAWRQRERVSYDNIQTKKQPLQWTAFAQGF